MRLDYEGRSVELDGKPLKLQPKEFEILFLLASQPGKTYEEPIAKYNKLMEGYKAGEHNYDQYVFMIQTAEKLQDQDTRKKLTRDLADHLATLPCMNCKISSRLAD